MQLLNLTLTAAMSAIELATVGVFLDVIFKMCNILSVSPKDLFDFRI